MSDAAEPIVANSVQSTIDEQPEILARRRLALRSVPEIHATAKGRLLLVRAPWVGICAGTNEGERSFLSWSDNYRGHLVVAARHDGDFEVIEVLAQILGQLVADICTVERERRAYVGVRSRSVTLNPDDDNAASNVGDRGQVLGQLEPLAFLSRVELTFELNEF